MTKKKILIVDDEINIIELLKMNLKKYGYEVYSALDGESALKVAVDKIPDIIILDIMMPGIDGLETCRRMKLIPELQRTPIIMLSARSEETDKVIGLSVGADDYITKPFGFRELHARITAALRRVELYAQPAAPVIATNTTLLGNVEVDFESHLVKVGGEKIDLTLTEFKILAILIKNPGRAITREAIINEISGIGSNDDGRSLDVHMRNLRKKIGYLENDDHIIGTVRGVGYKMESK